MRVGFPRSVPEPRSILPLSRARKLLLLLSMLVASFALAACGSDDESDSTSAETVSLDDCTPDQLETLKDGTLTIATDKPAFPPYFVDNDPTNGKGFESAVGYAIAEKLGFSEDQVEWTVVPFNSSYAPGPKDFDFDLNQISITEKRAEQVDFSSSVLHGRSGGAGGAGIRRRGRAVADRPGRLEIGVQIGTTSLDAVTESIEPNAEPQVFDTSNDVVSALENGQVDAIVVDTPTALYLSAAVIDGGKIVGEFAAPERRRVGRAAREGLRSDRLRLGRGGRAAGLRRAAEDPAAVDQRGRRRRDAGVGRAGSPAGSPVTPEDQTAGPATGESVAPDRRAERAAAKLAHDRRGALIAAVSTIVVLGGLAALVLTSPGWPDVREKFFDREEFRETFPDILEAFWLDIRVFVVVEIAVLALGLLVALVRVSRAPRCSRCGCSRSSTRTSFAASR